MLFILIRIRELQMKLSDTTHFEGTWGHIAAATQPHLLHEVGVGLGDLAPHSQGILSVNLCLILVFEEVLCE